jgi:hypothetical protein
MERSGLASFPPGPGRIPLAHPLPETGAAHSTEALPGRPVSARLSLVPGAVYSASWNSPSEIGTATFSIRVNARKPTAKTPAATRSSVIDGTYS